jgi:hypothetical protein
MSLDIFVSKVFSTHHFIFFYVYWPNQVCYFFVHQFWQFMIILEELLCVYFNLLKAPREKSRNACVRGLSPPSPSLLDGATHTGWAFPP